MDSNNPILSSSGSSTGSTNATSNVSVGLGANDSPLWKYVTIKESTKGGGNKSYTCNYCKEDRQGSITRVRAHLLHISGHGVGPCRKVTSEQRAKMAKEEDEFKTQKALKNSNVVSLPSGPTISLTPTEGVVIGKKRKGESDDTPIGKSFHNQNRAQLDCLIARMFYTGGLPFNLARNPYFISSYTFAANHSLGGYVPPGYNKLRTILLDQEKKHVETLLLPKRKSWPVGGVSIVTDGWSDPCRRPLINFILIYRDGPMFLKCVNCEGEKKDKNFIYGLMKDVIDEVGHENVVQVVTDNASNCKGAGELIEGTYPHIFWTPCVVHTLNPALKNICDPKDVEKNEVTFQRCSWIKEVYDDAMFVKNFIMGHSMRLAIFNRFTSLKLLSIAPTRFASMVIMLKRMKLLRRSLEEMVTSEAWSSYKEDDQTKTKYVRDLVLNEEWWEMKVDYILELTTPIHDMIRFCDTDKPCLHLVYDMWDSMIEKVKVAIFTHKGKALLENYSSFYDEVYKVLITRWTKNNTPLHCLAHSLNPRFYSPDWLLQNTARTSPNLDNEISTERKKCFRRLFPCDEEYKKILEEYGQFCLSICSYDDLSSVMSNSWDPRIWWCNNGSSFPLLAKLALKVLGQPASSSCAERNWSTYAFINSVKRNRLLPKRAEDLVYVHNNLRLMSRSSPQYEDGRSKFWDVGGDAFGTLDEANILEFAELSLDEPELEKVTFLYGDVE